MINGTFGGWAMMYFPVLSWKKCLHCSITLRWLYTKRVSDTSYADLYRNIDFRKHPEKYVIGRGEQGVLIAEPHKSEILPHWRFKTPEIARESAEKIYAMFVDYGKDNDFVGMDMARKFLQMGFTRARRYANHASGSKYANDGSVLPQAADWSTSPKAESARIFYEYYTRAKNDDHYLELKSLHQDNIKKEKATDGI